MPGFWLGFWALEKTGRTDGRDGRAGREGRTGRTDGPDGTDGHTVLEYCWDGEIQF